MGGPRSGNGAEIGARAATSLANWMVLSGRPDQALSGPNEQWTEPSGLGAARPWLVTAQAYAFASAGRSPEGVAVLGLLPASGNEVPVSETDALIMRGMLKLYVDDLAGAIADLGVAAARIRTGLPASYPVLCLTHLSDAHLPPRRLGRRHDLRAAGDLAGPRCRPSVGSGSGARPCRAGPRLPRAVVRSPRRTSEAARAAR